MLLVGLEVPGANIVYINATRAEAEAIMWSDSVDGLPAVAARLGIEHDLNKSSLTLTLENGSTLQLLGADRDGWNKIRGRKLDLLVADELQKADDAGLRVALDEIVPPALAARRGRFVGIGTPDQFKVGLWHDIVHGVQPGYSVHVWNASLNDRRPDIWEALLAWKARMRLRDDDPKWLREGLGIWATDDETFLHPIEQYGAVWDGQLPPSVLCTDGVTWVPRSRPMEVYGAIDFGLADATALVVGSISREEGVLREVYSGKRRRDDGKGDPYAVPLDQMTTAAIAEWIRQVERATGCDVWYGDYASATAINDLRLLYGINVQNAEKHDRTLWHGELESAFRAGEAFILGGSPLHDELKALVRDPGALLDREIRPPPGAEDHCYDAWRYLFRAVRTHHVRLPERPRTAEEERRQEMDDYKRRLRRRQEEIRRDPRAALRRAR